MNKQKYPKIKYRLVTGNGPSTFYSLEELQNTIKRYEEELKSEELVDKHFDIYKYKDRFKPKYIIKITEELIII